MTVIYQETINKHAPQGQISLKMSTTCLASREVMVFKGAVKDEAYRN